MLSVNIWEGATLFQAKELMRGHYGHAALSLPGGDAGQKHLYISWWPGSGETDSSGKPEPLRSLSHKIGIRSFQKDREEDRRFYEDMWSENKNRYYKSLLFTLPLGDIDDCIKDLESLTNSDDLDDVNDLDAKLKPLLGRVRDLFKKNGTITLSDDLHFGTLESGFEDKEWGRDGEWIVDDETTKTVYFIRSSHRQKIYRVFLNQGHKLLFSEVLDSKTNEFLKNATEAATLEWMMKVLVRHKAPVKSTKEPAEAASLGLAGIFIRTDKNDYYLFQRGNEMRFYHWTREYVAPTVNIAIPTLGQDKRGLDDQAIRSWWRMFTAREAPQWSTFDCNCSVIVATALNVGGAYKFASPPPEAMLLWNPTAVRKYAEAVAKGIAGARNPAKLTERAFLEEVRSVQDRCRNLKDIAKNTPMWKPGTFLDHSSKGALVARPQALKDIDKIMGVYWDAYGGKKFDGSAKSYGLRLEILNRLIERLADFSTQTKEKKRLDAVVALGEMVVAERAALFSLARPQMENKRLPRGEAEKYLAGQKEAIQLLGPKLSKAIVHR